MNFTNLSETFEEDPRISSLNQGSKFNGMQKNIVTSALPCISLLEKTTMPGINSMREPLANMDKGKTLKCVIATDVVSKNGYMSKLPKGDGPQQLGGLMKQINTACNNLVGEDGPHKCGSYSDGKLIYRKNWCEIEKGLNTRTGEPSLPQMDQAEFKKLNDLETQFSKKLSEYVTAFKSRSSDILTPEKCGPVERIIKMEDSKTPMKDGTTQNDYYETWLKTCATKNKKTCSDKDMLNNCEFKKTDTSESDNHLKHLNDQLMALSNQMWEQTQKIRSSDIKIQEQITKKRQKLNDNISKLNTHRAQFSQLDNLHSTLDGQLQDNRLRNDSAYIQYLVWFVAATTIGAIAVHRSL